MNPILITGGAGYIGSHVVKALGERGYPLVIYDNLSKGHKDAVLYGHLVIGDLADSVLLESTLRTHRPSAVLHFAAFIESGESVQDPGKYYRNNFVNTVNLLSVMSRLGIDKLVFSSSAAVYGNPLQVPIKESAEIKPINPYGRSKAFVESFLEDMAHASSLRYVSLRYFNVAGADSDSRLGERHAPETHLIPLALEAAAGKRPAITVYGTDYPTEDGTCIRDYIHIEDLVEAHLLALRYLEDGGTSDIFNCGYGHGYSVRQVIDTAQKVTGVDFPIHIGMHRPGDPGVLVSDSSKIRRILNWTPKSDDLEFIIRTAWNWERGLQRGPREAM